MMSKNLALFLILTSACALDLPPEFQKCKRSDPKFDECLAKAIEHSLSILVNGVPEFNLDPIDPVKIPSLSIGEGTGAVHVEQNYKNVEIHNIQKAKIKSVKSTIDDNNFKLSTTAFIDLVNFEGQYSLHGNILVFPITGNGTCTISLHNLDANVDMSGDIVTKKEEQYINIKDFKIKLVPHKIIVDFRNLFNGDQLLGSEMNKLLNENWKAVYEDVVHKYEEVLGTIFKRMSNLIFQKVPHNKIFLP